MMKEQNCDLWGLGYDGAFMKLLLVAIHIEESPRAVPLGPAMLASVLRTEGPKQLETALLDLYLTQSVEACVEQILGDAPDYVGFSVYVWNRDQTLVIAERLRALQPDLVLFAGGPEPSAGADGILERGTIDFLIKGEGEESIVPAMTYLLEGGKPAAMPHGQATGVADLDALPSPILDGTLDLSNYSGMLWELSRGCPFKCDFCYESRGTAGIRRFPMTRVRDELQAFTNAQVEQLFVLDPTFNYNRDQAKEILQLIRDHAPDIYFFFEVRSEFVDAEMAELFGSIGCALQIGLQSASDTVLRNINRRIDPDDFEEKMLLLHQHGAVYGFDLIYGLPGDTLEGFCASLDFAMGLMPNHIDIFPLSVLPGTRLHETAPTFQLNHQADSPYQVIGSPTFSVNDMAQAARIAKATDQFYNQGQAVPWFAILTEALALPPSALFAAFADHLDASSKTAPIIDQQLAFAAHMLRTHGKEHLAPLAIDIITYFGMAETMDGPTHTIHFNHNPDELISYLEAGLTDLEELSSYLAPAPCDWTTDTD
jgi:radical SAM superfamily enzyme YgiQ (UPF0313 family)